MNKLNKKIKKNGGMSYIELIVVLSIFSAMTSIVLFNYGDFQAKVDIKNLASDIALKVVEAQKMSLSGQLPPQPQYGLIVSPLTWKPSYGVSFDLTSPTQFVYFVDLNNLSGYEAGSESLNTINITKGNLISQIEKCTGVDCPSGVSIGPLSVTFKRPDSRAVFHSNGTEVSGFDYIRITIASPKEVISFIKIYPSGRIQVN